jgi:hypothetical protein
MARLSGCFARSGELPTAGESCGEGVESPGDGIGVSSTTMSRTVEIMALCTILPNGRDRSPLGTARYAGDAKTHPGSRLSSFLSRAPSTTASRGHTSASVARDDTPSLRSTEAT